MGLDEYKTKRDFQKTAEPPAQAQEGGQAADLRRAGTPRLEPALRLPARSRRRPQELVGAQGAIARSDDERLAVQVEDQPIAYATFEGNDPRGNTAAATSRSGTTAPTSP